VRTRTFPEKNNFFTATFLLFSNNNTTKFQLHLQFFLAHATFLKAFSGFQYILNIITVSSSADADLKLQDPHISGACKNRQLNK